MASGRSAYPDQIPIFHELSIFSLSFRKHSSSMKSLWSE